MATRKRLTPKERERWVRAEWDHCSSCGSDQLDGGTYEADANYVTALVRCLDCQQRWREGYTLSWMDELS